MPGELQQASAVSDDKAINLEVDALRPPNTDNETWSAISRDCYGTVSKTTPYNPTLGTRLEYGAGFMFLGAVGGTYSLIPLAPISTIGGAVVGGIAGGSIGAELASHADFRKNFASCVADRF